MIKQGLQQKICSRGDAETRRFNSLCVFASLREINMFLFAQRRKDAKKIFA
jgi:hypothetical protein